MDLLTKNGVSWLEFSHLAACGPVTHAFSTRLGGVSEGPLGSLNLGYGRGDDPKKVTENLRRFGEAVGFDPLRTVKLKQIHSKTVLLATEDMAGNQTEEEDVRPQADALITNIPQLVLTTFHADCVPLYFVDPVRKAIGLAHAGWKGTVLGIGPETLKAMEEAFGTQPKDVLVGIGPSIGPCCFQVGPEVEEQFRQNWACGADFIRPDTVPDKYKIDLWGFNRRLLTDCGVPENQIVTAAACTKCRDDLFYSHRRQGEARGTMAAFLMLR